MSNAEDLVDVHEAGRPAFDQAMRGYDKRQVDIYVHQAANEIVALQSERERALGQAQTMAAQMQRLQAELA